MSEPGEGGGGNLSRRGFWGAMAAVGAAVTALGRSQSSGHQRDVDQKNLALSQDINSKEAAEKRKPFRRDGVKIVKFGNTEPRQQAGTMADPITAPNLSIAAEKVYSSDVRERYKLLEDLEPLAKQASGVNSFLSGDQVALPDPDMDADYFIVRVGESMPGWENEWGVFKGFNNNEASFKQGNAVNENRLSYDQPFTKGTVRAHIVAGLDGPSGKRLLVATEQLLQKPFVAKT